MTAKLDKVHRWAALPRVKGQSAAAGVSSGSLRVRGGASPKKQPKLDNS